MKLIEKIVSKENMEKAIRKVKSNKGAPGVVEMTVDEIGFISLFEMFNSQYHYNANEKSLKLDGALIKKFVVNNVYKYGKAV